MISSIHLLHYNDCTLNLYDTNTDVSLLKFIIPGLILWFGCKRTAYVGTVRGRSTGKEVIPKFIPLGYLDVQVSKRGGGFVQIVLVENRKDRKKW
jgi:hypothetical protein